MTEAESKAVRRRAPRGRGDELRSEIITAAKGLLESAGDSTAVSIRGVADAVGVTPPSIYLHFADKDALLEAVVADVFAELDAAMLAAAEGVDDPMTRLCAYGMAYIRFAVEHPEHYRLATMELHPAKPGASQIDHVLADASFAHMNETVGACIEQGIFAGDDPLPITLELWAVAHGVAALLITKPFLPWGDKYEFANRALGAVAVGRAVQDTRGEEADDPAATGPWLERLRKQQP